MAACVEVKFGAGDHCLLTRGSELFLSSSMCHESTKLLWPPVDFEGPLSKYVWLELSPSSSPSDCRALNATVKFISVSTAMTRTSSAVILLFASWYKSGRFHFENRSNCHPRLDRVSWIYIPWTGKEDNQTSANQGEWGEGGCYSQMASVSTWLSCQVPYQTQLSPTQESWSLFLIWSLRWLCGRRLKFRPKTTANLQLFIITL